MCKIFSRHLVDNKRFEYKVYTITNVWALFIDLIEPYMRGMPMSLWRLIQLNGNCRVREEL